MRINTNVSALNAWRNLTITDTLLGKSMEKLSSGYRIVRAADDAAGLAISEKMRAQIIGLKGAVRNAQDGISLLQTAEGALDETHSILRRMRELAGQAASDALTDEDRAQLQSEFEQLQTEITRIANTTEFNTKKLLDGTLTGATILIGPNTGSDHMVSFGINSMSASALGVDKPQAAISTFATAVSAIDAIDAAIKTVSTERAKLGALQNRLEHTLNNLNVATENLTAAESRIRDVDMALEMANFTRHQILVQAGTAMLAQANLRPQSVLKLLG